MPSPGLSQALLEYARLAGNSHDEMVASDGRVRPHHEPILSLAFDAEGREERIRRARQYLSEAGVHHHVHASAESSQNAREWPLAHPALLIKRGEWNDLARGLIQRAGFLERLLADIYGERCLVREGVLPSPIIGRNPEFCHPLADQARSGDPLIRFIAVDLGRGPDGRWWVLGDRTQAPSGAGFALENRVANQKAYPDVIRSLGVERLAPFFQRFRDMLYALAGPGRSRVGLLSPGPNNESYFEHAYLARYLGLLLLEGGDLVVHDRKAMIRTVSGFQPISVLWRRLDGDFTDPLELFGGSRIGTPGLLQAVRAGQVRLVNAIGSSILETPAFFAFQAPMARALLDEDLKLPTLATWWCGEEAARTHVEANRVHLQMANAFRPEGPLHGAVPFDGSEAGRPLPGFDGYAGVDWIAREVASLSTTPILAGDRIEPRPVTLRVFLSRDDDGWHVMPGGFARVAAHRNASVISMSRGGSSIDIWVPSEAAADRPERSLSLLGRDSANRFERRLPGALPSRAGDNLFWLGRYVERCEVAARLVRAYGTRMEEFAAEGDIEERLLDLVSTLSGAERDTAPCDTLLLLARQALQTAERVRDRFSPDGWRTLNEITAILEDRQSSEDGLVPVASIVLTHLAGFVGLVHENMYQFVGWRFMQIGRALERASASASVIASLIADDTLPGGALQALLDLTDSRMTYRRRYTVDLTRETVLDLVVLDPLNPRSIAHQVGQIRDLLFALPGYNPGETLDMLARRVSRLSVRLQTADASEIDHAFVDRIAGDLVSISLLLAERYFVSSPGGQTGVRVPE